MDSEFDLLSANIAIIGLGLMGGSLAMALQGRCAGLFGFDNDTHVLDLARKLNLAERIDSEPEKFLSEADVVIFATPVRTIIKLVNDLPRMHSGSAIVMDLGSTKVDITSAMNGLPTRFDPIGGHPMCGKETFSLRYAEPGLYRGAPFAFTPLSRTSEITRSFSEQLAKALGANPLWLDAKTHDRWVSATSHLPYLVANALAAVTPGEAHPLVGSGLRSTTRLAPSSIEMMIDILLTNRINVLEQLKPFQTQVERLERMLSENDGKSLRALLSEGYENYQDIIMAKDDPGLQE